MRDVAIAHAASEYAECYDLVVKAEQRVSDAKQVLIQEQVKLVQAERNLLNAVKNNASALAIDGPIVIRVWKDHMVAVDILAEKISVALAVDRE